MFKIPVLSFILFTVFSLSATEDFTMAFSHEPSENLQYKFFLRIYTEAFKELGYNFKYETYPGKRASLMANSGEVDGEPQRIYSYGERYKNLIRVEESIFTNRTLAFTINPEFSIKDFQNLDDKNYRIDYLRGSVWSKDFLESKVSTQNITSVTSYTEGYRRLLRGFSDIFIALEAFSLQALSEDEFQDSHIINIGIVGSNLSYPYLHKSHSDLAVKLAVIIREMKNDGRYNMYLNEVMPFLTLQ